MTGSGCLSRVMGPVFVTYIYTKFGTNWTFGLTTVMMVIIMVWLLMYNKRLQAHEFEKTDGNDEKMCEELQEMDGLMNVRSEANHKQ